MNKHLGITKPDESIMFFIRQILQRAKEDRVSLGIYDDTNNNTNQRINETKVSTLNFFFHLCISINIISNNILY